MSIRDRNYLTPAIATIVAIASWFLLQMSAPEQTNDEVFAQHSADYYSIGYQKREMNTHGVLSSEIKAAKMVHYSDDNTVHLEAPVLSFYHHQSQPWIIKADNGVLSSDGKELWLHGTVTASRAATQNGREITIKTSEVRVRPETNDAETTKWAELISPPDVTTGVGMQLHFVDPIHIKLMSDVRGKYESH